MNYVKGKFREFPFRDCLKSRSVVSQVQISLAHRSEMSPLAPFRRLLRPSLWDYPDFLDSLRRGILGTSPVWRSRMFAQPHPALIAFTSRSYISMLVLLLRRAQPDGEVSHVDAGMEREKPKVNTDRGAASTPFYSPALPTGRSL